MAGVQAGSGIFSTCWWIASVIVIPTEQDSHRPRRVTVMWSAAVLDPAFPGRSRADCFAGAARTPFPGRRRVLLVGVREDQDAVHQIDRHLTALVGGILAGQ
jgi:hypothetical protein